jgi:hypothetical protein
MRVVRVKLGVVMRQLGHVVGGPKAQHRQQPDRPDCGKNNCGR